MRLALTVLLLAGCVRAGSSTSLGLNGDSADAGPTSPSPDAGPSTSLGLSGGSADAGPASKANGDFSPLPLSPPGNALPANTRCAPLADQQEAETTRRRMTLGAFLAARGDRLLRVSAISLDGPPRPGVPEERGAVGTLLPGNRLVVAVMQRCDTWLPAVALRPDGAVYQVLDEPQPRTPRRVHHLCFASCLGGCGTPPPPTAFVAEVPPGAHLIAPQGVRYPIDTLVDFALVDPATGRPTTCGEVP